MKNIWGILLSSSLFISSMSAPVFAKNTTASAWTQVKGLPNTNVASLLYANGTLYAEMQGNGVWTYRNSKWARMKGLPQNTNLESLVYANGTLYAGTGDPQANTGSVWMCRIGKSSSL